MALTKANNRMIDGSEVNVLDFIPEAEHAAIRAGTSTYNATADIQAALDTEQVVRIPRGTYLVDSLDLKGIEPIIVGDGMNESVLKANSAVTYLLDAFESSDKQVSPIVIKNIKIDGSDIVTGAGLGIRYRHFCEIDGVFFQNYDATGSAAIFCRDTWLNMFSNIRISNGYNGLVFDGSNHASTCNKVSVVSQSNIGIICNSNGTANDGNAALQFNNCDVEFGSMKGVELEVTSAAFRDCYMGENLGQAVFEVNDGNIFVDGGIMFVGHTTNTILATGTSGEITFNKCHIVGQTSGNISRLMDGSANTNFKFIDCTTRLPKGGDHFTDSDCLDNGPPAIVFADRLGKNFSLDLNNVTATNVLSSNNGRLVTCSTAPGPNPVMTLSSTLIDNSKWRDNEELYLVLVYKADISGTLRVRLSGSALGGLPTSIIGLPPQTSNIGTYIKIDSVAATSAFNVIELSAEGVSPGDFVEIQECFLADSRMLNTTVSVLTNLYKC